MQAEHSTGWHVHSPAAPPPPCPRGLRPRSPPPLPPFRGSHVTQAESTASRIFNFKTGGRYNDDALCGRRQCEYDLGAHTDVNLKLKTNSMVGDSMVRVFTAYSIFYSIICLFVSRVCSLIGQTRNAGPFWQGQMGCVEGARRWVPKYVVTAISGTSGDDGDRGAV